MFAPGTLLDSAGPGVPISAHTIIRQGGGDGPTDLANLRINRSRRLRFDLVALILGGALTQQGLRDQ